MTDTTELCTGGRKTHEWYKDGDRIFCRQCGVTDTTELEAACKNAVNTAYRELPLGTPLDALPKELARLLTPLLEKQRLELVARCDDRVLKARQEERELCAREEEATE